jgi:hypothetical protein
MNEKPVLGLPHENLTRRVVCRHYTIPGFQNA